MSSPKLALGDKLCPTALRRPLKNRTNILHGFLFEHSSIPVLALETCHLFLAHGKLCELRGRYFQQSPTDSVNRKPMLTFFIRLQVTDMSSFYKMLLAELPTGNVFFRESGSMTPGVFFLLRYCEKGRTGADDTCVSISGRNSTCVCP